MALLSWKMEPWNENTAEFPPKIQPCSRRENTLDIGVVRSAPCHNSGPVIGDEIPHFVLAAHEQRSRGSSRLRSAQRSPGAASRGFSGILGGGDEIQRSRCGLTNEPHPLQGLQSWRDEFRELWTPFQEGKSRWSPGRRFPLTSADPRNEFKTRA